MNESATLVDYILIFGGPIVGLGFIAASVWWIGKGRGRK